MCLDVPFDDCFHYFGSGLRRARNFHECLECARTIEAGETYWWETTITDDDGPHTSKMCCHCRATIELGCALTGCPEAWFWGQVHDLHPENGGFVGDILTHDLSRADRLRMLRTVAGRRRRWRRRDGTLLPAPSLPEHAGAA